MVTHLDFVRPLIHFVREAREATIHPTQILIQTFDRQAMYSQVVFLMVLMVAMALIQGTWSAPQNRPQISIDDIVSVARAILSRLASSGI
uniref:Uncharacterized protein n=1 Tax=Timema bartmani TaxID=61472 RepID=A0A7R9F5J1_9NEOP|nr:unnamed protein product [Timema bartmani]